MYSLTYFMMVYDDYRHLEKAPLIIKPTVV